MTLASLEDVIVTHKNEETTFTEEDGSGILEILEFMMDDYSINYLFDHGYIEDECCIKIKQDDYKRIQHIIEYHKEYWY